MSQGPMKSTPVEFCSILALRSDSESSNGRSREECLPTHIEPAERYHFDKAGQRIYPLGSLIPLFETRGNGHIAKRPIGSVIIEEVSHYLDLHSGVRTRGVYKINDVFLDNDPETRAGVYEQIIESP